MKVDREAEFGGYTICSLDCIYNGWMKVDKEKKEIKVDQSKPFLPPAPGFFNLLEWRE